MSGYKRRHSEGSQSYLGKRRSQGRQSFDITRQEQQKTLKQDLYKYLYAATVQDQKEVKEDQESTGLTIVEFAKLLSNAALESQHEVSEALVDCASQVCFRTSMYATLSGLLNVDDTTIGQEIVNLAVKKLQEVIESRNHTPANLLLRFLMYSTNSRLVDTQSAVNYLSYIVQQAIIQSTDKEENPRLWQSFTDHLIYMVLLAIPYGLPELAEGASLEYSQLIQSITYYMQNNRRIKFQPGLRNFLADSGISEDDPVLDFDSGGAGFLEKLFNAVTQLEQEEWRIQSINQYHIQAEQHLAKATSHKISPDGLQIVLPTFEGLSTCSAHRCVLLSQAYPPRGFIALLPATFTERKFKKPLPQIIGLLQIAVASIHILILKSQRQKIQLLRELHRKCVQDLPKIERIIVENNTIDSIIAFKGHLQEAATKLTNELEEAKKPLILETVYGQLLKLPQADLPIVGYASFICTLSQAKLISKSLGTFVNQNLRPKIGYIDYELRYRLAIQLSIHISNLQFYWPWAKWDEVVEKRLDDPQRRFVTFLLLKLQEISFFDKLDQMFTDFEKKQIQQLKQKQGKDNEGNDIQVEYTCQLRQLIEPLRFLYKTIQQDLDSHNNDEDMQVERSPYELETLQIASQFLEQIAQKVQGDQMTDYINEIIEKTIESTFGGDTNKKQESLALVLKGFFRALIERGIKTNTHSLTMFRRYKSNLEALIGDVNSNNKQPKGSGESLIMQVSEDCLLRNQQKLEVVCSQLMNLGLVKPLHVICHLVESQHMTFEDDVSRDMSYYEIICNAIEQCCQKIEEKEFIIENHHLRVGELKTQVDEINKIETQLDSQQNGDLNQNGKNTYDEMEFDQSNGASRKRYLTQQDYEQIEEYEKEASEIEKEIQDEQIQVKDFKGELQETILSFFHSYISQILQLASEDKSIQVIQMRYMFSSLIRKYALQCSEHWPDIQRQVLVNIEEGREEIEEFILQYICY